MLDRLGYFFKEILLNLIMFPVLVELGIIITFPLYKKVFLNPSSSIF
jgi:hypothetical protein